MASASLCQVVSGQDPGSPSVCDGAHPVAGLCIAGLGGQLFSNPEGLIGRLSVAHRGERLGRPEHAAEGPLVTRAEG